MPDTHSPLGDDSVSLPRYAPEVLFPIARADSRNTLAPDAAAFHGIDIWNAWELTWLGPGNKPRIATAEFVVPADTPNLIESKSLKLYLNSFAMTRFEDYAEVTAALCHDLSGCAGGSVSVSVKPDVLADKAAPAALSGQCLDALQVECHRFDVDADALSADDSSVVEETLHTHLLRSLCPVTAQPDLGSVQVHYRGARIDAASLLRYIVSFREHNDYHEACVERMFTDIQEHCRCEQLSVYARFQRRGGIDINPFRSNFEDCPGNLRLWRQ